MSPVIYHPTYVICPKAPITCQLSFQPTTTTTTGGPAAAGGDGIDDETNDKVTTTTTPSAVAADDDTTTTAKLVTTTTAVPCNIKVKPVCAEFVTEVDDCKLSMNLKTSKPVTEKITIQVGFVFHLIFDTRLVVNFQTR